jgi:cell wall assembly regulator SMI1
VAAIVLSVNDLSPMLNYTRFMASIEESWQGIKAWFSEQRPEVLESLNPGAQATDFAALEKRFPQLPEEFYQLYRLNDGQMDTLETGIFMGLPMLSLKEVAGELERQVQFLEQYPVLEEATDRQSVPPGWVKPLYYSLNRIPIAHDSGGNYLGVDLDPGPAGRVGQIINYGRDEDYNFVIAQSLSEFLTFALETYRDGRSVLEEDVLVWNDPRMHHFFDVLHILNNTGRFATEE